MEELSIHSPLVSVDWLQANINHPDLVILEASMPKPQSKLEDESTRLKIKNARIFDIEKNFSDPDTSLPHMMPTTHHFTEEAQKLGVNHRSIIVVYDCLGIYSSPRAWWMFRVMGHDNVFVLDGGLPAWKEAGLECEPITFQPLIARGDFVANYQASLIRNYSEVLKALDDENQVVMDARSEGRFYGKAPEPRPGLRGGHMPNAVSLPFETIQHDTKMMSDDELKKIFASLANKDQELIFSCGSGVTACILALGATLAGYDKLSVYDGSWAEWGIPSELPVVT